jgi:DNA-binding CsgD family transcriptional regulator
VRTRLPAIDVGAGLDGADVSLLGRHGECATLDDVVADIVAGGSQALVLRGEAGIGKTALLGYLVAHASECRVVRAVGIESEMELPFAGLHQLCAPMLDRLGHLPDPQSEALATAFGLRPGEAPDRLFLALATLTLLSEVAAERPLLCVVDDAQWLDHASAQALGFVARRLDAEAVALVFAERESSRELAGLVELVVGGLADDDARAVLDSVITGPLDEEIRDLIVAETHGNPLALIELPHGRTHAELAGGFWLPTGSPLSSQIEESFRRRLEQLPPTSRELLLIAAAEPVGDPLTLWRAAERVGLDAQAAEPASRAGLIEFGGRVRFRHPLVRSAVYRSSSQDDRLRAHRALADATDPRADPDRRAWHLAHATPGHDEAVAAELEESAGRAQARGGLAAAAAFLRRAVLLTSEPEPRARRALAAAQRSQEAGSPNGALELLAVAEAGPLDELQRARADLVRAEIRFVVDRGRDAPPLLLAAAKRLETLDAKLSRETYLDAFSAALFAGRLARNGSAHEVAEAVLAASWGESDGQLPRACDLLLEGVAVLTTQGHAAGVPALKSALAAFRDEPMSDQDALRWLWLACRVARALGDDASWDTLSDRQVRLARQAGALSLLPIALIERFGVQLFFGDLTEAQSLVAEAEAAVEATGSHLAPQGAIALAAWRGAEHEVAALIDAGRQEVERRGEGLWLVATEWASAVLFNSLGRYADALAVAERAGADPHELGVSTWVPTEFVEAAVRSGVPERATDWLRRLQEISRASGTDWALGVEARSRALVSEGEEAERLYREAIERLGRTRVRIALARAHLLYGEWLRREGRRVDARTQLRTAYRTYADMGMEAFAERARRELVATGETVRKASVETRDELTAQEAQIARMAAEGSSNPEIAAQLFLSPRTVEWHLGKVFIKLGIRTRGELHAALPSTELAAAPSARP